MPTLKLYHAPTACSKVTLTALEECSVDYDLQVLNMLTGEQKTPEYLAINPKGKIPALLIDNQLLTENVAIVSFLNATYPAANLLPQTQNELERATHISDLTWCSAGLHPMARAVRMPSRFTDGETAGVKAKGEEYFADALNIIEDRLSQSKWWYGDDWSIVDMYIYWNCFAATLGEFDLSPYPSVVEHGNNIRNRAPYQRAIAREKQGMDAAGVELPDHLLK